MKFTRIPEDTFKKLQLNAGVLLKEFNPEEPGSSSTMAQNILGATSGGLSFSATPEFRDDGEDIDNCPKNTKELKHISMWTVELSGTFVTCDVEMVKRLTAASDSSGKKVTPRADVAASDFADIWMVADYSDENGETNGGYLAIHMLNALSTGGFSIQTGDKAKGQFAFTFTGHYSMAAQTVVPFEVFVQAGQPEPAKLAG